MSYSILPKAFSRCEIKITSMAASMKRTSKEKTQKHLAEGAEGIARADRSSVAHRPMQPLSRIDPDKIYEGDMADEEEMTAIMKLEEISLKKFLEDEPDIYSLKDLKVRYK